MLVDSNILIYAINADSTKHKQARLFLKDNLQDLQIAHQNILETLRVITHSTFSHPLNLKEGLEAILSLVQSFQIIVPNNKTHYVCFELIQKHNLTGNRIFDAYLTATALTNNTHEIATDNERDFLKIKEIKVINPFQEGEPKALRVVEGKKES